MLTYIIQRLFQVIPTLIVISILIFLMIRLIPGDPALLMAGQEAGTEIVEAIRENLGLNEPLYKQYFLYLSKLFSGSLKSIRSKQPVMREIGNRLPATLILALSATLIFCIVGTVLGIVAAVKLDQWQDYVFRIISLIGVSMPTFWLGAVLMMFFAVELRILPAGGRGGILHLILPAVTTAMYGLSLLSRLIRSSLLEILNKDYMLTARAKGLSERVVISTHALRNALIPAFTVTGLEFARLLGGVVVVETVFAWPGLGRLLILAIHQRDYPMVQSAILVFALILMLVNLLVDILIGFLDPRIRYD